MFSWPWRRDDDDESMDNDGSIPDDGSMPDDLEKCPICLEPMNDDDTTALPHCGHRMHTSCALETAWSGHVGCPVCRELPHPDRLTQLDIQHNQERTIRFYNNARMQKACTSGLRKAKGKAASRPLKTAVKNLHTAVQKNAKHAKQVKSFKEVHKLMMAEIDGAVAKIKTKYTKRELKKGNDGALMAKRLHVRVKSLRGCRPVGWGSLARLRKRVAKANGWSPVRYL